MDNLNSAVQVLIHSSSILFVLLEAATVLATHADFAFLEVGTVRLKNQVNALSKILSDFATSAPAYLFVGYRIAYGMAFFHPVTVPTMDSDHVLVRFFFLLTFAMVVPAIVSGGIAECARFGLQLCATALIVAFVHPFFEGLVRNGNFGLREWLKLEFDASFRDFVDSVVVHVLSDQLALAAVLLLGSRNDRYRDGKLAAMAPSSIPFLALGSWVLVIDWFGFNMINAQTLVGVSGLVAVNSLLAMAGDTMASLLIGRNDSGSLHNGPLAGSAAVCAGSDLMHPIGALATGLMAGTLFVWTFTVTQVRWKIDGVLSVQPLHGLCGAQGGTTRGIFNQRALGGLGGVSLVDQALGNPLGVTMVFVGGLPIYGLMKALLGIRLSREEEYYGADLSTHKIGTTSYE